MRLVLLLAVLSFRAPAQSIKVEYDKNRDLTVYKTFRFGESEIVTPKDQKLVSDEKFHQWIREVVTREFTAKGLSFSDSAAQLIVTYVVGTFAFTEMQKLGPLGTSPNSSSQTWTRDYKQSELIIDVNDARSQSMVWRVNAIVDVSGSMTQSQIESSVQNGFKKFYVPLKAKKKKR